ncbi:AraC family transcriptional regulator [Paenibacillus aceris]|uniref:AraC family L-rhamnose operon transcriptional activator RhaR n=1 Tax=Paenibacillus aceris TaxID=869555 RepID=A0ABS4HYE2_9BACL|nr:AraC family transcriptional regulator [Paenibacillus aceris]MBP1963643.1 AraC family L-rhamnose operon transcriptional activator RhaR [Paenibacillus aceris]NHW36902.1 AraC family transcriptional regulator [Paenibacillus aceris]
MLNEVVTVINGPAACFKIQYWGIDPCLFDNQPHKHSFFEICYVISGEGEYTEEGTLYPLRAGTHFCSRPGITHQIRTTKGLFICYVAFELDESQSDETMRDAFNGLAAHAEVCIYDGDHHPTAHLWKSMLMREGAGTLPATAIPSLAYTLLVSFLGLFGKDTGHPFVHRKNTNLLLQRAKLYIRDNLSQPLHLGDVAGYLNVSERHLSRLFSEGIHETYTDFIRSERIRQAAHLLLTSELPIKEIAEATGFSSVHYFTQTFKHEKKLPPGRFRKQEQTGR